MVCPGNSNELCGAGNFLSVYNTDNLIVYQPPTAQKTNLPGSWGYVGCFTDNINNSRVLFWQIMLTNNNTATSCLGLCQQYGYMAAGMVGTDGKNHFPTLDSFMTFSRDKVSILPKLSLLSNLLTPPVPRDTPTVSAP
jgi:hypothetical protein